MYKHTATGARSNNLLGQRAGWRGARRRAAWRCVPVALLVALVGLAGCQRGSATQPVGSATATSTTQAAGTATGSAVPPTATATEGAQPALCHPADTTAPFPSSYASIYAGASDGTVTALNAGNGSVRWRYATGVHGMPALTVGGSLVYASIATGAAGASGLVVALGATDGAVHWHAQFSAAANVGGDPALIIDSGTIYIGALDGSVHALNSASGAELWHFQAGGNFTYLAVANGTVYVQGQGSSAVYALRANSGAKIWSFATTALTPITPVVANGLVYVAASDSQLAALDAATGTVAWRFQTGDAQSSGALRGVTIAGTGAYVNAFRTVYAVNASSGALCWQGTSCGQGATTAPLLASSLLYAVCFYGDPGPGSAGPGCGVFTLDAGTGAARWTYNVTGFPSLTAQSLVGGVLYVGGTLQVAALNASNGAARWAFPAQPQPRQTFSLVAVVGSTAYAGGPNGSVYALNAGTGAVRWHTAVSSAAITAVAVGP
jgi:outer membrane protein assembly factor BamB